MTVRFIVAGISSSYQKCPTKNICKVVESLTFPRYLRSEREKDYVELRLCSLG